MTSEDKSLVEFLQAFDDRKRRESGRAQMEIQASERKRAELAPVRTFLQKFVDLGLVVRDSAVGQAGVDLSATRKFSFYEAQASPSYGMGVSLYFDHPAEVEIAIPNPVDKSSLGSIVIRSVTSRKGLEVEILHQKFDTVDKAKAALAVFLGKNAVSIENDPRKARRAPPTGKAAEAALRSAPEEPPAQEE